MEKDYYKVLGVDKKAPDGAIKKAYRKLALQYHPDKNKGDKKAEERFKEINEAYAVLSDKEKRKQYDMFGTEGFHQRFSQEDIFKNFNFKDIFSEFGFNSGQDDLFDTLFGMRGGPSRRSGGFHGRRDANSFSFNNPFGTEGPSQQYRATKGEDITYPLSITLEEVISGGEKTVTYRKKEKTETVTVKIPKGISTGKKLRLPGKGMEGGSGGPPGNLYFTITVKPHPLFTREGDDIYLDKEVPLTSALLGTSIDVETFEGTKRVKVPPGTQSHTKIRLKNHGIPYFNKSGRGDQYVKVFVKIPRTLTSEQKELVEKLKQSGV